jgi:DNA uptake protein ComE-like DNA-binding protein
MNLNNAEMRELVAAGITPDQARLLVLFRERIGGFATLQELVLIPGLSAATRGILRSLHE